MPDTYTPVRVTDVLDPLTGARADLEFDVSGPQRTATAVVDGSALWVLPGLYDADAHLPVLQYGVRELDRWRALAGGAVTLNSAVPWHLVEPLDLDAVTAFFASTSFPRILPILSISDQPSSAGFPAWIGKHGAQIRETWMPTIKLYSNDPNFWPNLEAIWSAGCRAAIYFYDEQAFADVVASRGGPVHFRHVISAEMCAQVESCPDSTSQTSPHFLIELPPERPGELFVLPPVPGGTARDGLRGLIADHVDLIASDHNAPIAGSKGPGLEIEQHLLPALLALIDQQVIDLPTALAKVTTAPATVFKPAPSLPEGRLLVEPTVREPARLWPGQEARRAAFRDVPLTGSVLAAAADGRGLFL